MLNLNNVLVWISDSSYSIHDKENAGGVSKKFYMCFVDVEKAF